MSFQLPRDYLPVEDPWGKPPDNVPSVPPPTPSRFQGLGRFIMAFLLIFLILMFGIWSVVESNKIHSQLDDIVVLLEQQVQNEEAEAEDEDEDEAEITPYIFQPDLTPWSLGDWNSTLREFTNSTDLSIKQYIYNSVIPFNTNIFGIPSDYKPPVLTTRWGSPSAPIPNVGVIGSFDYALNYSQWGGDPMGFGIMDYPLIISDFGHGHIYTVHSRSRMLRADPTLDVSDLDMTLDRLNGGSAFLFAKFAGLVDVNGNFIPYAGDQPVTKQIKDMFYQFIFGDGVTSYADGASLSLAGFSTFITNLINTYGTSPLHKAELLARLTDLQVSMGELLRLSGPEPLALVPWLPLMTAHQIAQRDGCMKYTQLYSLDPTSQEYTDFAALVDLSEKESISMGLQMAAFFVGFEGTVNILDKLMVAPFFVGDDYAIPLVYENAILHDVKVRLRDSWMQHVVTFRDWNQACALQDHRAMYESETAQTEGCGYLAKYIGVVFFGFDTFIDFRGFYSFTDTL